MKKLSDILERKNDYKSYSSDPVIDGEYIVLIDCNSFGSRQKSQDIIRCDYNEVEEHLKDWFWEFNNYWTDISNEEALNDMIGMTRHDLIYYNDEMKNNIKKFVSSDVKSLKPWESTQFVFEAPKCSIVAAIVIRTNRTGILAQ